MSKEHRVNNAIRAREVRVVDQNGEQLGIMPSKEALKLAEERQMDLVEVAPQAKPPVCRVMDYGRYKYEQSKKDREARKKQSTITVKEVKLRPNIEEHDFKVKTKNAARFLKGGDKVKVTIMFRGREIVHPKNGQELLNKVAEEIGDLATMEKKPKLEGKNMFMILAPNQSSKED